MAKDNSLTELKKQIKENSLKPIYLFYGEEEYLKELYIKQITELIPDGGMPEFNHLFFNGMRPFSEYDDAWESFPMMAERRLIVIKDSEIVKQSRGAGVSTEDKKAFWGEKLKRVADDTVVIFDESSADRRSSLFKAIAKCGLAVEFDYLKDAELVTYAMRQCSNRGKKIKKDAAQYLVSRVDPGLGNLNNELEKLFDFCGDEIYASDIERVVSKSLNVITFDLTNAIMSNNAKKAVSVLNDIKSNTKNSSFSILYLLLASFEKILHAKLLAGRPQAEIAAELSASPYIARKYIESARHFSVENLTNMVTRIAEIDLEIKEGKIDDWTALYTYVTECLYYMSEKKI
ncbi:MAG: DNA polymerase III subunit delta [Firmicutes bacterium]|nr:DNA polymerase III subunit delta [Bacillota bacterium]